MNRIELIKRAVAKVQQQGKQENSNKTLNRLAALVVESETVRAKAEKPSFSELDFN